MNIYLHIDLYIYMHIYVYTYVLIKERNPLVQTGKEPP